MIRRSLLLGFLGLLATTVPVTAAFADTPNDKAPAGGKPAAGGADRRSDRRTRAGLLRSLAHLSRGLQAAVPRARLRQDHRQPRSVVFEKPGKMSWRYTNNGNRVVSDGKLVKVYEKENKQMYEQPLDKSQYPAALSFLVGGGNLKTVVQVHQARRQADGLRRRLRARRRSAGGDALVPGDHSVRRRRARTRCAACSCSTRRATATASIS